VRDGPDWVLEAGALVLADGGVCCIDEFSTIRSHDKAAVHEAMEQQTVSVAKAGLVCRLRSQCSVVAAQNCRGNSSSGRARGSAYDLGSSLAVNSGLPPPLLSRFDLVVVFADGGKGGASEQEKADFILSTGDQQSKPSEPEAEAGNGADQGWNHDRLRDYIAWAKALPLDEADDPGAADVLQGYFQRLRSTAGGGVTVRTLESIVRLTQAHAKLMGRRRILIEDAVAVVALHRAALQEHVVGAEEFGEEAFATQIRVTEEEKPACLVQLTLEGVELHHGSDIRDLSSYVRLEQAILRSLGRRRNGRFLTKEAPGPRAIADVPRPTAIEDAPPSSQAMQPTMPGDSRQLPSQGATSRGKRFGCRMR